MAPRNQLPSPVHIPPDNFNSTPQVYPAVEQNVKQAGEVCSSLPLPRIWHLCRGNLFYERTIDTRLYPTYKVRSGAALCWSSCEEIPHVQGKRNPSKIVGAERGHQRADTLKPQSQKTSQSDHMDHSLVSLNETKPCHVGPPKMEGLCWRGLTECGPLEKGMANHFSILALRIPWTVWKGKKDKTLKDELPRSVGAQ